jgi:hypothetical protein
MRDGYYSLGFSYPLFYTSQLFLTTMIWDLF